LDNYGLQYCPYISPLADGTSKKTAGTSSFNGGKKISISSFLDQLPGFTTIFLGILIEATPFLLLGAMASGLIKVFVSQEDFARYVPTLSCPPQCLAACWALFFRFANAGLSL
jgi:uncharacterized protein